MHARTTLSGTEAMLNNFADQRRSLADSWEFDETLNNFDPQILLGVIMLKGSNLQPVFTDPKQFYMMNQIWWKKWQGTFYAWCNVLEKEYEPLWDRNSFIEIAEHTDEEGTLDTATSDSEIMDDDTTYSKSGTSKEVVDDDTTYDKDGSSSMSATNMVSAFDSSTYQPHDTHSESSEYEESGSGTDDRTTTVTWSESGSGTDDRTTTKNGTVDTDTTGTKDHTHSEHAWGNAGISMTSQKLLKQELDIRYWNIYEHISDIFLDEMTVRVF